MRASPDDILGMAFFAHVVEARSFSAAARTLGVSKSAVSARVARLEERLGVALLHRTTRKVALTADGVRFYERCARVVAEADQAAEIAAGASDVPRGTLRVSAPAGFAETYLTGPIGEFMNAHDGVRIDLRLIDRAPERIIEDLDIAIVIAERLSDSGLAMRKLASVGVAACASPSYLRSKGIPFRPQDLVLHTALSHSSRQRADDLSFQTDEGAVSMASLSRLVADDARFLREAALAGLGIAMLPELLIVQDLAVGRLHRVLDDFHTIELGVHALHPHGRLPPASVRAFLDHLALSFRAPPWAATKPTEPALAPSRHKSTGRPAVPMTEQEIRRLTAVAALYEEVEPKAVGVLCETIASARRTSVAKIPRTLVTMNSRLRMADSEGRAHELTLVYPWDQGRDRVSLLSPLGLDLLGRNVGDTVTDGHRKLTVRAIAYQPEASGDHHL